MATFTKRGNGWRVEIRRKGFPKMSATFDLKTEGARWAAQVEGDMAKFQFVDGREAQRTTLRDALKRYRDEISVNKKSAVQEGQRIAKWLEHPLADRPLAAITSSDLASYRDSRKKAGIAGATIRNDLAIIRHLFNVAAREWGMGGMVNPVMSIKLPAPAKGRTRRPSADELAKVLEAAKALHPELPAIIELAADTAMRRSELVNLRREQVRGRVAYLLETKNGDSRAVPLSPRALEIIRGLVPRIDGRLFSIAPLTVTNYFPKACEVAKVEDLHFHDLRHEATSRLFERGFGIMEVAAITGHKTLSMLKRYTHLSPEGLADKLALPTPSA